MKINTKRKRVTVCKAFENQNRKLRFLSVVECLSPFRFCDRQIRDWLMFRRSEKYGDRNSRNANVIRDSGRLVARRSDSRILIHNTYVIFTRPLGV